MHYAAVQQAFAIPDLRGTHQHILIGLASFARRDGFAFCSQQELAERLGLGERTVRRHLAELEERGLIRRDERYQKGRKLSDGYALTYVEAPVENPKPTGQSGRWSSGQSGRHIPANLAASSTRVFSNGNNGEGISHEPDVENRRPPRRAEPKKVTELLPPDIEALLA